MAATFFPSEYDRVSVGRKVDRRALIPGRRKLCASRANPWIT